MIKAYTLTLIFMLQLPKCIADVERYNYVPPEGVVPDAKTAVAIAIAVLSPIYGAQKILQENLTVEKLEKEVWFVKGNLSSGHKGGVAEIAISKADGRIILITHGK